MIEQHGVQASGVQTSVSFSRETFDSLRTQWMAVQTDSRADFVFSFPEWQELCWRQFREPLGYRLCLTAARDGGELIGIAPLVISGDTASFIGTTDVCDYLDFIVRPGYEERFFSTFFKVLHTWGVKNLDLAPLRPDSTALSYLSNLTGLSELTGSCTTLDVSVEVDLPGTWDDFLDHLDGKQRHEVRRKLKRLEERGAITYQASGKADPVEIETFLRLMRISRRDKAAFMTPAMEAYFKMLARAMADRGVLKICSLRLNGRTVAATMSFNYGNSVYLYNSGYDPDYAALNVGLASKLYCIRDSIDKGKRKFDFLKGGEVYKLRLGGREVPLQRCLVRLNTK
ncbi:MAG: GNAT family N-acetyltransferase [Chloroflexota bacterium]